jgi:hypothetical protein
MMPETIAVPGPPRLGIGRGLALRSGCEEHIHFGVSTWQQARALLEQFDPGGGGQHPREVFIAVKLSFAKGI